MIIYVIQLYRGRNSIVYHCRQHIGDYPYRCEECGFAEVSQAALNDHQVQKDHSGIVLAKIAKEISATFEQVLIIN